MKELTHAEKKFVAGGDLGLALATVVLGGGIGAAAGTAFAVAIPNIICRMFNHTAEDCSYAFSTNPENEELGKFFVGTGALLGSGIGISAVGSVFSLLK